MSGAGGRRGGRWRFGLMLGALVLLLSGCGLDQIVPAGKTADHDSGGTLHVFGGFPPTLDPALAQDATSAEYIVHLYSGLVRLDAEMEILPDLAVEWSLNDAGTVYTFILREDARFADGRPITAEDVVYSWQRALEPALASPVAMSYLGDIVGAREFSLGEVDDIAGLEAVSATELRVELSEPRATLLSRLTYPVAFVVDREQMERVGSLWLERPNGSGPFVLEKASPDRIVLARNENYYGEPAHLARVEYLLSGGYPVTLYETGALDLSPVPPDELERLLDTASPLSAEMVGSPRMDIQYIGLNVDVAPFDDPLVRQAFTEAIDRERIAAQILRGTGVMARGILPPGLDEYNQDLEAIPYDPAGARALLEASSYGGPEGLPPIVLAEGGTSGFLGGVTAAVVELLQENLGVSVIVHQVEWADFLQDLNGQRYQMYATGWIADYASADNFLELLFYSESSQNHTGYSNPQVDQLLDEARSEQDADARRSLYRRAEQLIVQDAVWIPLYHGYDFYLVSPRVKGYHGQPIVFPWLMDIELVDAG